MGISGAQGVHNFEQLLLSCPHASLESFLMIDEYSDEQLERCIARAGQWYDEFEKSSEFESLTSSQKRKAGAIVEFLAEYSYSYLLVCPEKWECESVKECCADILPRKVSAEREFFEAISPVLAA